MQCTFSGQLWWKRTFKLEELALSRPKESDPLLTIVSYGDGEVEENGEAELAAAKTALLPVAVEIEMDSGERRLNELGYKQELRREMVREISDTATSLFSILFWLWTSSSAIGVLSGVFLFCDSGRQDLACSSMNHRWSLDRILFSLPNWMPIFHI